MKLARPNLHAHRNPNAKCGERSVPCEAAALAARNGDVKLTESLAMCSQMHPKGDQVWMVDSVGETPTDATGTVALPGKSLLIGEITAGSKVAEPSRL